MMISQEGLAERVQHPTSGNGSRLSSSTLPAWQALRDAPETSQAQGPGVHPDKAAPGDVGTGWGSSPGSPGAPSKTRKGFFSTALFPEAAGLLNTLRNGEALEAAVVAKAHLNPSLWG